MLIGDGNQKDRLVERTREERLANVLFFPPVRKGELARITASFDCGLMILADVPAFYFGTAPNKFFDFLSSGVPVVVNYPGWMADMVATNGAGVAVPPGSPGAFADALERLAGDRELTITLARNSRNLGEREFDRHLLAGRFSSGPTASGRSGSSFGKTSIDGPQSSHFTFHDDRPLYFHWPTRISR